ncbi:L-lactate permease [soil metagenome]
MSLLAVAYTQDLNPLDHRLASTLVAALPVLVLFYLLVARRWLASWAGAAGALVAILIAWLVYKMPLEMASWAFVHGAIFGLLPIGWTVFAAMMLYNLTVVTGQFTIIRRSIAGLSGDGRIQSILIGFSFGAFMEGAAGAGSPVAICGAMLVGLGVPPLRAAVICLIANTSPVCYGGLGVPIITLADVTDIPVETISVMCGHQLPFLSCVIPLYMVKCCCTWKQTLEVWPALFVGGGSFAVFQYVFATFHAWAPGNIAIWPLTDIGGGMFSLITLAIFLKFVWKPRSEFKFPPDEPHGTVVKSDDPMSHEAADVVSSLGLQSAIENPQIEKPLTAGMIIKAWSPFAIMALCLAFSGWLREAEKKEPGKAFDFWGLRTNYTHPVPTLHKEVERADKLQKRNAKPGENHEDAVFKFIWATAPGTPVFVSVLISALVLGASPSVLVTVLKKTVHQMKVPIPTIACMLGLSYVTKYAGIDATLGVAFAETGALYPFFAAMLGWLGVFLTGTDAGSNALFGSLQKITAGQIFEAGHITEITRHQAEVLICTANSTGGVMGKMIDAQSICVATAGTNQIGREADIFKKVIWHSLILACVVGLLTALQAYVMPFCKLVPGY